MTGTAVATRSANEIGELMTSDKARKYIEPFLPPGTDVQRVAAAVMLAVRNDKTGALAKCTPESLVLGVARIGQWGLELGVTAHLIPFGKVATPVADYKGLCELMIASKAVRFVEAREVREGDEFSYEFGLDSKLVHRPHGGKERLKKPITHVYCIFKLPFGASAFDVMTVDEVEEIRQKHSKQWKDGPLPGWYARKTILRRGAKLLPKTPALARLFQVIDEDEKLEVANEDTPATTTAERIGGDRPEPENCICNGDTGEVDPNCPVHGDWAREA